MGLKSLLQTFKKMADFTKTWQRNVRFSVNRFNVIKLKISSDELNMWHKLVQVLQERRNTGPQIETFLYLLRKYQDKIQPAKFTGTNPKRSVSRFSQLKLMVNDEELQLWNKILKKYGSSKIETFTHIIDAEFNFQDELEIIQEEGAEV